MSNIEERLAAKDELTPEEGFNLVGLDDFEEPGDELYLVAHFGTREEAEAALAARQADDEAEVLYVYGSDDDNAEGGGGDMDPKKDDKTADKKEKLAKPGETSQGYATRRKGEAGDEYVYEKDEERDPEARFVVAGDTREGAHYEKPQDSEDFPAFSQWRAARKKGLEGKSIPKHLVDGALRHAERHHYDTPTHHQAYDDHGAHEEAAEGGKPPPSYKKKPPAVGKPGDKKGKKDPIEMVGKLAAGDLDLDPYATLISRVPPDAGAADVNRNSIGNNGLEYDDVGESARAVEREYEQHYGPLRRSLDPIDALDPLSKGRGHKYKSRKRVGDHWVYEYDDGSREHGEDREARLWHEQAREPKVDPGLRGETDPITRNARFRDALQSERASALYRLGSALRRQDDAAAARWRRSLQIRHGMTDAQIDKMLRSHPGNDDEPEDEALAGKYTDKHGAHHEHPESKKQVKWAWAAEERGELPKGTAHKWASRFYGKAGLHEFNLAHNAGALQVPENLLYDYLCAFVEEALEHERRECRDAAEISAESIATPVLHELVAFIPKNPNLRRAAIKHKVTAASIAQIIEDKHMLRAQSDDSQLGATTDLQSMAAMGAVGDKGPTGEVMLASRGNPWVQQSDPQGSTTRLALAEPARVRLDDDLAIPVPSGLHKAQLRAPFAEGGMRRVARDCLLHGDPFRDQLAVAVPVSCTCG